MVELVPDMPPQVLGFRISGHLTGAEYASVLAPPLHAAVQARERIRALYAIGPGFHMEPAAMWEDLKLVPEFDFRHRDALERIALVTDLEWLHRLAGMFVWMFPGDLRLFHESELEQAKAWLAE